MRYPEFIREGDTIAFVAPSFGCATEPYQSGFLHAIQVLEGKNFRTQLGPNCFASNGIGISSSPKSCGEELTSFYLNQKNQALISCGGGELMCETLPWIDFRAIAQAPAKWYMGYSDNTNFTFLSATLANTAAIYGPNAAAFGMEPWHESIGDALDLLQGKVTGVHSYSSWQLESTKDEEHPLEPYNCTEQTVMKLFADGEHLSDRPLRLCGRLLGGNLDCLSNLVGTEYDQVRKFSEKYREDGILWFLESCDLTVFGIRRALWQMKHAGWFGHVKAFLIGRPYCFGQSVMGLDQYAAVIDILKEFHVPILMDLDIGHLPPMMPLICGASCNLNYESNKLTITYTWK